MIDGASSLLLPADFLCSSKLRYKGKDILSSVEKIKGNKEIEKSI